MRGEAWDDERIALLKQFWTEGHAASAIASRLGISRSAVLGKVFRLRLDPPGNSTAAKPPSKPAGRERDSALPARRRGTSREELRAKPPSAGKRGRSLLELTNECCRWPHGRPGTAAFHFCGAGGADLERGIPYCARHAARAFVTHDAAANAAKRPSPLRNGGDVAASSALTFAWKSGPPRPTRRWERSA